MPGRILVIEDHPANLELMSYLLRAFGHTVIAAMDGEKGLDLVTIEQPDLVVCDVHLPRLSGYEVVRHIKKNQTLQPVPVIAVTALAMVGDREKLLSSGFTGYIAKPITAETFVQQLEQFLDKDKRSLARPVNNLTHSAAVSSTADLSKGTIMVVDDQSVNLTLKKSILEPLGYTTITTSLLHEAKQLCKDCQPDLIISDIHLSDGSGFDLLQFVKADSFLKQLPFLFLTSTATEADRALGLRLGASKVLTRPIDPETLVAEIESFLPVSRHV